MPDMFSWSQIGRAGVPAGRKLGEIPAAWDRPSIWAFAITDATVLAFTIDIPLAN